jgi:hypothetical protein
MQAMSGAFFAFSKTALFSRREVGLFYFSVAPNP